MRDKLKALSWSPSYSVFIQMPKVWPMTRIAIYLFDNVPLPGWLCPYVFGLIIGRMPHKKDTH